MIKKLILALLLLFPFNMTAFADHETVDNLIAVGMAQYEEGDYVEARYSFNQAIVLAPERADVFFYSAKVWQGMGDWQQAVGDLSECIRVEPDNFENYTIRAYLWAGMKNVENAQADIAKAMELQPDSVSVYYARAVIFETAGMYDKAILDYTKAIELNKKTSKSKRVDSMLKFAEFVGVHICDKEGAALYFHRGMSLSKSGESSKAKKDFKVAVKLEPKLAESLPEEMF